MGKKSLFDHEALAVVLMTQNGVITRSRARDCGMSRHGLEYRVRVGGPWQPLLPGVYLTNIIVLHFSPGRLRTEPAAVASEIRSALEAGHQRGRVGIRAVA